MTETPTRVKPLSSDACGTGRRLTRPTWQRLVVRVIHGIRAWWTGTRERGHVGKRVRRASATVVRDHRTRRRTRAARARYPASVCHGGGPLSESFRPVSG
jgi:hypothetical protein